MNVYNDKIEIYVNGSLATTIDDNWIYEYLCEHSPESVSTDDDEIEYVLINEEYTDFNESRNHMKKYIETLENRNNDMFSDLGKALSLIKVYEDKIGEQHG